MQSQSSTYPTFRLRCLPLKTSSPETPPSSFRRRYLKLLVTKPRKTSLHFIFHLNSIYHHTYLNLLNRNSLKINYSCSCCVHSRLKGKVARQKRRSLATITFSTTRSKIIKYQRLMELSSNFKRLSYSYKKKGEAKSN